MKIQLDKFLAITALIAGSAAAGQACSNNSTSSGGKDGTGGAGDTGGSGGDGGSSTSEGTGGGTTTNGTGGNSEGGEAGDNGTTGEAGATGDAGAAGDTGDGGTGGEMGEEFCEATWPAEEACEGLSFAGTLCDGDTRPTDGYVMCNSAASQYNADVLAAIMQCMEDIGGDPCDENVHGFQSFTCQTETPDSVDVCTTQTAADLCSEIECSALEEGECEELLSRYPDGTVEGDPAVLAVDCFRLSEAALGVDHASCADNLRSCLQN
jgi:hypothetical protein